MYRCILISVLRYREFRADAHWRNYDGLTLLGGDPMEESNQEGLLPLLQRIHKELPEKNIWAYTGYLYDKDLVPGGRKYVDGVTDRPESFEQLNHVLTGRLLYMAVAVYGGFCL